MEYPAGETATDSEFAAAEAEVSQTEADEWVRERAGEIIYRQAVPESADPLGRGKPETRSRLIPSEQLAEASLEGHEDRLLPQPRKEWRVTVRMTPDLHAQLIRAAQLYGVPPTTLARMLINRGARAIVEEERRASRLLGPED